MTINRYGIAATLQTLASQVNATILGRGGNAVDAAFAANAAVRVIGPMMNGFRAIYSRSCGIRKKTKFMLWTLEVRRRRRRQLMPMSLTLT
jgi:hypothetical protein